MDGTVSKKNPPGAALAKTFTTPLPESASQEASPKGDQDVFQTGRPKTETKNETFSPTAGKSIHLERPAVKTSRSTESKKPPSFITEFFDGRYKSPGSAQALSSLRDRSFSAGLPFLFAVADGVKQSHSKQSEAFPCATFYARVDLEETRATEGDLQILRVPTSAVNC